MAKRKRHGAAEIATKLLVADALSAQGQTQADVAKALGISVMTFHRWRKMRAQSLPRSRDNPMRAHDQLPDPTSEHGSPARVAQLQLENARLRKLVTDLLLEKMGLEDD
jgi:putative transposase